MVAEWTKTVAMTLTVDGDEACTFSVGELSVDGLTTADVIATLCATFAAVFPAGDHDRLAAVTPKLATHG